MTRQRACSTALLLILRLLKARNDATRAHFTELQSKEQLMEQLRATVAAKDQELLAALDASKT